jgi:tryptophan synthase alpha chain
MSRLSEVLAKKKADGKTALFIYLTAGTPDMKTTLELVGRAEKSGADVIELGIPFSDPIADGPVIQASSQIALKNGATMKKVLELVREIRKTSQIPIMGMGYINNFLSYGLEKCVADFKEAGIDGFIIPDVPHEESGEMRAICAKCGVHLAEFVTPNTVTSRILETCTSADGFIYCVSVNGVTGVREIDYTPINNVIDLVRKETDVPLAVGFGIGSPKTAVRAAEKADAIIIGSAVVKRIMEDDADGAMQLIADVRKALDERVR